MANRRRFCYTLDVLTDGSEHTGSGTLFLSVWKIPMSIRNATTPDFDDSVSSESEEDDCGEETFDSSSDDSEDEETGEETPQTNPKEIDPDPYSWLTGNTDDVYEHQEAHTPVARYAISGLGDATARLCADQKFKQAQTRACFVPERGIDAMAADGLSALLLALYGAGAASLHLVLPSSSHDRNDDAGGFVEELASSVLGTHKHLDIRTCEVREPNERESTCPTWWKVYEDDHLIVHACSSKAFVSSSEEGFSTQSLVYLYSFPTTQFVNPFCTLALFPPRCRNVTAVHERLLRQNLPMIRDGVPMASIEYVLFLDPNQPFSTSSDALPRLTKRSQRLMTLPRNDEIGINQGLGGLSDKGVSRDEGILIRSQQLHRYFCRSMPSAFAAAQQPSTPSRMLPNDVCESTVSDDILVLQSGTSIVLEKNRDHKQQSKARIWDRRTSIWNKALKEEWTRPTLESLQSFLFRNRSKSSATVPLTAVSDENEIELEDETDTEEDDSRQAIPKPIEDENEIDLEEEEDEESVIGEEQSHRRIKPSSSTPSDRELVLESNNEIDLGEGETSNHRHQPRLLVLGTGCATPSAYRGASGYALVLPRSENGAAHNRTNQQFACGNRDFQKQSDLIYLLDCGEGVSTMLSRNYGDLHDWKQKIRGIWISHAHLDHYGGLPTLLRLLCKERESYHAKTNAARNANEPSQKRPRHDNNSRNIAIPVPWVIAPAKVLRYLDIVLDCQNGISRDGRMVCFEPRLHFDPRLPPDSHSSPLTHFENLKVNHNCCPAFGLLVGWKTMVAGKSDHSGGGNPQNGSASFRTQFLCYSGDTRPSQSLVRACNRAVQHHACRRSHWKNDRSSEETEATDLFLIHEATYRDSETSMAQKKKHSTIGEAFEIATRIPKCSRVLMTHFSQRYDNCLPPSETANGLPSICGGEHGNGSVTANGAGSRIGGDHAASPSVGLAVDGLWIDL